MIGLLGIQGVRVVGSWVVVTVGYRSEGSRSL